jgi:hypothetical protein
MANIRVNSLSQKPTTSNNFTYSDISLDLKFNYTNTNELRKDRLIKDSINSYDYGAIRNSIVSLFTTIPGQKILNPYFGLNLAKYLFEPVNEDVASNIANDITRGISTYEPRVKIRNLVVGYSAEQQIYKIDLTVSIPQINNQSFQMVGTLSNSGFFLNN